MNAAKYPRTLSLPVLVLAYILVFGVFSLERVSSALVGGSKIDARVLEDTANGQTAHFLVLLAEQADVRGVATRATDRLAQGRQIVQALRQTADRAQPALIAHLQSLGVPYRRYWIVNLIAVEGNRTVVEALAARADVKAIESNHVFRVELPSLPPPLPPGEKAVAGGRVDTIEWNLDWINAPDLWTLGYSGQGITYANADTGVQWEHPALKPQYQGWNGATADHNYHWWDAIHNDLSGNGSNPCGFASPQPCDDQGHGTHTTGIGVGDDGGGNQIGVAPGARWIACRNMEENYGRPETYLECFQFFLAPTDLNGENPNPDLRPDVVGNSYGCPPSELCAPHSLQTAMENLRAAGVFMAVSAGNNGPNCSTISNPPGLEDSAITVGMTNYQSNTINSMSSRGPVIVDGSNRRKPDLVAPGASVRSSYPPNGYISLSGTSMSAPHVAGAVALLWSAFPEVRGNVDFTEYALEQSALPLTTTQGCGGDGASEVPNNVYGYGQIDVSAAYAYLLTNPAPTPTPTPTSTPAPETVHSYLPLVKR